MTEHEPLDWEHPDSPHSRCFCETSRLHFLPAAAVGLEPGSRISKDEQNHNLILMGALRRCGASACYGHKLGLLIICQQLHDPQEIDKLWTIEERPQHSVNSHTKWMPNHTMAEPI